MPKAPTALFCALLWLALLPRPVCAEQLVFDLHLGPLPLGEAVMESRQARGPGGEEAVRLSMEARVSTLVSVFCPGTTSIEALARADYQGFFYFHKTTRDGDARREWRLTPLPHKKPLARRETILPADKAGKRLPLIHLPKQSLDPLTGLWLLRSMPLDELDAMDFHLVDGKRAAPLNCLRLGRENISTPLGDINARVVEIPMHGLDGLVNFREDESLVIWLGPAPARLPLRMEVRRTGSRSGSVWQARLTEWSPDRTAAAPIVTPDKTTGQIDDKQSPICQAAQKAPDARREQKPRPTCTLWCTRVRVLRSNAADGALWAAWGC